MAIEEALADLRSGQSPAQFSALDALAGSRDERVQRAVVDVLGHDSDAGVRAAAAEHLPDLAIDLEEAAAAMIAALADSDELVRAEVADGLGRLGHRSAVTALTRVLADESSAVVRAGAVESLGDLGDASALEQVETTAREDTDEAVRAFAAASLGILGAADPLLRDLLELETSPWVRAELTLARFRRGGVTGAAVGALLADADADQAQRILNGMDDLTARGDPPANATDISVVTEALAQVARRFPELRGQADAVTVAWRTLSG